jgi:hypothetical protein
MSISLTKEGGNRQKIFSSEEGRYKGGGIWSKRLENSAVVKIALEYGQSHLKKENAYQLNTLICKYQWELIL